MALRLFLVIAYEQNAQLCFFEFKGSPQTRRMHEFQGFRLTIYTETFKLL